MPRSASFNRNEKESITSPPGSAFEELELSELSDAVPELRRFLELELLRGLLHLFRQPLHFTLYLLWASEERCLLRHPPLRAGRARRALWSESGPRRTARSLPCRRRGWRPGTPRADPAPRATD